MSELSPVSNVPVIRIAYTANISETSQFSFETYAPQDMERPEINEIVDKLVDVAGRQLSKAKVDQLKFELEGVDKQIGLLTSDLADRQAALEAAQAAANERHIKSQRRGEVQPTSAEATVILNKRTDVKNTQTTLDGLVWRRGKLLEQIEEHRRNAA